MRQFIYFDKVVSETDKSWDEMVLNTEFVENSAFVDAVTKCIFDFLRIIHANVSYLITERKEI